MMGGRSTEDGSIHARTNSRASLAQMYRHTAMVGGQAAWHFVFVAIVVASVQTLHLPALVPA